MSFYSCNLGLRKVLKNSGSQVLGSIRASRVNKKPLHSSYSQHQKTMEIDFLAPNSLSRDFLGGSVVKRIYLPMQELQETQVRLLVGKILWRRKWQSTPICLPGKSHGQKSLGNSVHSDAKSWTRLSDLVCMYAHAYVVKSS